MIGQQFYLSVPKGRGGVYAKTGTQVTITHLHGNVAIVEREDGFRFSAKISELAKEWVEPEKIESKQVKQVKESNKKLTQAEKLQVEYLKSIGKL